MLISQLQKGVAFLIMWVLSFSRFQEKNLSCVTNVAEASTEWTTCAPT